MQTIQQEIDERTNLTSSNKLELLLFRLGNDPQLNRTELFGINVFKVREIIPMPEITAVAGSQPNMMGVVDLRGQILPVIDLAAVAACTPSTGLNILLITEYARSTQAFAVESVEEAETVLQKLLAGGEASLIVVRRALLQAMEARLQRQVEASYQPVVVAIPGAGTLSSTPELRIKRR